MGKMPTLSLATWWYSKSICKLIHKIHFHRIPTRIPSFLSFHHFSFFFPYHKTESCFSEQEIRTWFHSTGQSNREMTGATGNGYLQLLFIYLFRPYQVQRLKKGRKAIFIFLMGLPSADNILVLFAFSRLSREAKCAGNSELHLCLKTRQKWNYSLLLPSTRLPNLFIYF